MMKSTQIGGSGFGNGIQLYFYYRDHASVAKGVNNADQKGEELMFIRGVLIARHWVLAWVLRETNA